jgi:hypothetical protein
MGLVDVMSSCNIARVMYSRDDVVQGNFPGSVCSGDDVDFVCLTFFLW